MIYREWRGPMFRVVDLDSDADDDGPWQLDPHYDAEAVALDYEDEARRVEQEQEDLLYDPR